MFDGKNAYMTYSQNLIGVDTPVAVPKKTKEVEFVDKKYTESSIDRVENKDLTPEERIRMKLSEFGIPVALGPQ
jgi:hypothetical protein